MKTMLLTGGTGDIGNAIKEEFLSKGYKVIAPTRSELDLSSPENIRHYFESNFNEFSCFVHCAGYNDPVMIENLEHDKVSYTMQVNTFSFLQITQCVLPSLRKFHGKIVAISSLYGSISREGRATYTMSKHALNGLVKTMALEFGQDHILVNSLSPGFVSTQMTKKNNSLEKIQSFKNKIPLGELAETEEIAKVVYFLCSEQNSYISGQDIVVDGGFIIGGYQK